MPPCIIVSLVEMKERLDVDVLFACPLHQVSDELCGFSGAVDVMHEVTEAINDDKPYIRGVVDGIANDGSALFGISYGSYQLLRSHPGLAVNIDYGKYTSTKLWEEHEIPLSRRQALIKIPKGSRVWNGFIFYV